MVFDVVVVGGGWGGLGTGALLAHGGARVLLLESRPSLGGRASYLERDGFLLDYGIHGHRFGRDGAAAALYKRLGETLELIEQGPGVIRYRGRDFDAPSGPLEFIRTRLLPPGAKLAVGAALARMVARNPERNYYRTVAELLPERLGDEARFFVSVLTGLGLVSQDLETTSAGEFASFLQVTARVPELMGFSLGGCRQHVKKLGGLIEAAGEVRTGFRVERVLVEGGAAVGVEGKEGSFHAGAVVLAVPLPAAAGLLPPGLLKRQVADAMSVIEPTAGLSWDVGLNRPVTDVHTATVLDPLILGSFNSNFDESVCPAGKQLSTWCMPLPPPLLDDPEELRRSEELLRRSVFEIFPAFEGHIQWDRMMRLPMIDGAVPAVSQPWPARPAPGDSGVPGLFFAGDTVGVPGQGGDIAFTSALRCAPEVLSCLG